MQGTNEVTNTVAVSVARKTFITANGARDAIKGDIKAVLALIDYYDSNKNVQMIYRIPAFHNGFNALLGVHLANVHYQFLRMTKPDAQPSDTSDGMVGKVSRPAELRGSLFFMLGAVSDPWLYGNDEQKQQAAVTNLYKAAEISGDVLYGN